MKRQVITVLSIAAISFLIGTMFSVMASDGGSPWDRVWTTISELESKVENLEARVEDLESQRFPAPDYDSGWVYSDGSKITLNHNLGTTEVFVYLIGKGDDPEYLINQDAYGLYLKWLSLTPNEISLYGQYYNPYVRVMIWKISEPPA